MLEQDEEGGRQRLAQRAGLAELRNRLQGGQVAHARGLVEVAARHQRAVGQGGGHLQRTGNGDAAHEQEDHPRDELGGVDDLRRVVGQRRLGAHCANEGGLVLLAQREQQRRDAAGPAEFLGSGTGAPMPRPASRLARVSSVAWSR